MLPYPELDPVALSLGPLTVHWYGLTYLAGLAFAWWLAARRSRLPWTVVQRDQVDDLIFYAALGVVLGGRIGYAFFYGGESWRRTPPGYYAFGRVACRFMVVFSVCCLLCIFLPVAIKWCLDR